MATQFKPQFTNAETHGLLLWQAAMLWQRKLNAALKPHGLTQGQYLMLNAAHQLAATKTYVTQADVAAATGVDKMMASVVIRALHKKKLLQRTANKADARATALKLTELGKTTLAAAAKDAQKTNKRVFDKLGANQKENLDKYLGKLLE